MGIFSTWQGKLYDYLDKQVDDKKISAKFGDTVRSLQFKEVALYIATSYIANTIGNCEFKTYKDGKEVKEDLYYELNINPNPNQNGSQFKNKLIATYFYNEGALVIPQETKGRFYVVDDFTVEKQAFKDWKFTGLTLDTLSINRDYKMSNVLYFQLDNQEVKRLVDDIYNEYGKIMTQALGYYAKTKGTKYKLDIEGYAAGDANFRKIYEETIKEQLKEFMEAQNAVYPQFKGYNLQDMNTNGGSYTCDDILKIRKESFEIVAQAFKIPMSMMYGNITNMNEITKNFLTFCIDPVAKMIGDEFNRKLFTYEEWKKGYKVKVDTSSISHLDILEVADKADKLVSSGVACVDEVRERLGMDLLDTEFGRTHFITKNYENSEKALKNEGKEDKDA